MLTPAIVADEQALWTAIDAVLRQPPGSRARRRKLTYLQRKLKSLVSPNAWRVYLDLEAAVNERHVKVLISVVRWAFGRGVSAGPPRGEPR